MEEVNAREALEQEEQTVEPQAAAQTPDLQTSEDDGAVLIAEAVTEEPQVEESSLALKAVVEAAIYITDEPLTADQIALATEQPLSRVKEVLAQLTTEYNSPGRGLSIRELAGGYKMSTRPEFHEPVRRFVKKLQPSLKLSLAALETLAVIAYKQPITGPEILDIRGVQGASVLKTLLDRKLIATAGRKNVVGKPMMYKTTREFLIQFGLNSLGELPTLKEFEELGRMAFAEDETVEPPPENVAAAPNASEIEDGEASQHQDIDPQATDAGTTQENHG